MAVRTEVKVRPYRTACRAWPELFREIDDHPRPMLTTRGEISGKSANLATARRCAKRSEAKRKPLIYNAVTAIRSTVSGGEIAFGT